MATPTLLGLPHELQIWIYRLVLVQPGTDIYIDDTHPQKAPKHVLALLATNREIYSLAKPIFYGSNTFVVSVELSFQIEPLQKFITALGPENINLCQDIILQTCWLGGKGRFVCCVPYFAIDFKAKVTSYGACDSCSGTGVDEFRARFHSDLRGRLGDSEGRPRTRNWSMRLVRDLEGFVHAATHSLPGFRGRISDREDLFEGEDGVWFRALVWRPEA